MKGTARFGLAIQLNCLLETAGGCISQAESQAAVVPDEPGGMRLLLRHPSRLTCVPAGQNTIRFALLL